MNIVFLDFQALIYLYLHIYKHITCVFSIIYKKIVYLERIKKRSSKNDYFKPKAQDPFATCENKVKSQGKIQLK